VYQNVDDVYLDHRGLDIFKVTHGILDFGNPFSHSHPIIIVHGIELITECSNGTAALSAEHNPEFVPGAGCISVITIADVFWGDVE
jgi:hypothetical protein